MSTNDVPGASPDNADELHAGCWAEATDKADKSLILVQSTENDRVIYEMFDHMEDPPVSYRGAMPEGDFKKQFQAFSKNKEWVWHDKTPFPWDRVMELGARPGSRFASAEGLMTQARRVAQSLGLRKQRLNPGEFANLSPRAKAENLMKRMQTLLDELEH